MKKLDVAHCIVTLLLASLVALLCYSNYKGNRALEELVTHMRIQNQLEVLKLLHPCSEVEPPKLELPEMEKQSGNPDSVPVRASR